MVVFLVDVLLLDLDAGDEQLAFIRDHEFIQLIADGHDAQELIGNELHPLLGQQVLVPLPVLEEHQLGNQEFQDGVPEELQRLTVVLVVVHRRFQRLFHQIQIYVVLVEHREVELILNLHRLQLLNFTLFLQK